MGIGTVISITPDGEQQTPKTSRKHKGKSIIALPSNYVVIDTETTGLDFDCCDLIEVAALRIRDGSVIDSYSSLIKPNPSKWNFWNEIDYPVEEPIEYVDEFITELTGITNEMLADAPEPNQVIPQFSEFVGDDVILGHNVHFDINFLYDAFEKNLGKPLKNDFIDNLRIARKLLPDQKHHRLQDVTATLGVSYEGAHRAERDCYLTFECFERLKEIALTKGTEKEFIRLFNRKKYRYKSTGGYALRAKDIKATVENYDEDHPLFGKVVVFTGALSKLTRSEAMQLVVNVGGEVGDTVTKKTNYLVVGSTDFIKSVKDGKTSKMKKTEGLILKGQDISILSEEAFFSFFDDEIDK